MESKVRSALHRAIAPFGGCWRAVTGGKAYDVVIGLGCLCRHRKLLTDVAGVVFLVLLSLPPATVDVTVLVFLSLRGWAPVGQEKGVGVNDCQEERMKRASKQVAELVAVKRAGRGERRERADGINCFGLGCRGGRFQGWGGGQSGREFLRGRI